MMHASRSKHAMAGKRCRSKASRPGAADAPRPLDDHGPQTSLDSQAQVADLVKHLLLGGVLEGCCILGCDASATTSPDGAPSPGPKPSLLPPAASWKASHCTGLLAPAPAPKVQRPTPPPGFGPTPLYANQQQPALTFHHPLYPPGFGPVPLFTHQPQSALSRPHSAGLAQSWAPPGAPTPPGSLVGQETTLQLLSCEEEYFIANFHLGACPGLDLSTLPHGRLLGSGGFGKVFAVEHDLGDGRGTLSLALKVCTPDCLQIDTRLRQEAIAQMHCRPCPHILYLHTYQGPSQPCEPHYFLMDRASDSLGNILRCLQGQGCPPDEPLVCHSEQQAIMQILLESMMYLSSEGLVHGDIKPDNLLLTISGAGAYLKVADLGAVMTAGKRIKSFICSSPYAGPETDSGLEYTPSPAWDSHAAGVTLLELNLGPLKTQQMIEEVQDSIRAYGVLPAQLTWYLDPDTCDLIAGLMQPRLDMRLSAQAALCHPFFGTPQPGAEPQQPVQALCPVGLGSHGAGAASADASASAGVSAQVLHSLLLQHLHSGHEGPAGSDLHPSPLQRGDSQSLLSSTYFEVLGFCLAPPALSLALPSLLQHSSSQSDSNSNNNNRSFSSSPDSSSTPTCSASGDSSAGSNPGQAGEQEAEGSDSGPGGGLAALSSRLAAVTQGVWQWAAAALRAAGRWAVAFMAMDTRS